MHSTLQGLIFDFDGTLAELNLDFSQVRQGIKALQEEFLPEHVLPKTNWPILEKVDELSAILGRDQPWLGAEFATRCRLLITACEMEAAYKGQLFPYSLDVLDTLRSNGMSTGIITRNCSAAVRLVLPDVQSRCHVFLAREDVFRPKPHPSHVRAVLEKLDLPPEKCLLIGDHVLDIQAARASGIRSAAVATGRLSLQELQQESPDFLNRDLPELIHALYNQGHLPAGFDLTGL